ncbi:MAG: agmatine deiminase family protein [Syntrophobacteraceae bacterium]
MGGRRLPAEWEEQDGVLLAWPHKKSDWKPHLDIVEPVFVEILKAVSRFERVIVVAPYPRAVERSLVRAKVPMDRISLYEIDTNDTWARDFGPITVMEDDHPVLLNFGFNGWGLKFPANLDNRITRELCAIGAFGEIRSETVGLILEGGSIESDGKGTILSTARCLLESNRNPHLTREGIESALLSLFGAEHFLCLENGSLAGDDTDSHVDTLVRFAPDDTLLHVSCKDVNDEHFEELSAMVEELKLFRTMSGKPYRLIPLPLPAPCYDENGIRLPASYANFLIINDAVLVPTYGDRNGDAAALDTLKSVFPERTIIGIDCLPLISQHGSLHCVTMHIPKGIPV